MSKICSLVVAGGLPMTAHEMERYRRQLMLRGFTPDHQHRLRNATAFVAGVGGLGGTAALYLAVAGIGRLILVHAGNLTLSNMNRQVLMKHKAIGKSRVVQAKKTLQEHESRCGGRDPSMSGSPGSQCRHADQFGEDRAVRTAELSARRRILNQACVREGHPHGRGGHERHGRISV